MATVSPTLKLDGAYVNNKSKFHVQCLICGNEWSTNADQLGKGRGCKYCNRHKGPRYSTAEVIQKIKAILPTVAVDGEYAGSHAPLQVHCLTCGYSWAPSASSLFQGHGCPVCAGNHQPTTEEFKSIVYKKNKTVKIKGEYKAAHTPIKTECLICHTVWMAHPSSLLQGSGCYKCRNKKIGDALRRDPDSYATEFSKKNTKAELLSRYVDSKTPVTCRCLICGEIFQTPPDRALKDTGCQKCSYVERGLKHRVTDVEFRKRINEMGLTFDVIDPYDGSKTKLRCVCKKCGRQFMASPEYIYARHGCPNCNGGLRRTLNDFLSGINSVSDDVMINMEKLKDDIGDTDHVRLDMRIECKCPECHNIWYPDALHLLRGQGCPVCSRSRAERTVAKYLNEHNVLYTPNMTFDGLIGTGGGLLSYDFYLPDYNYLIEIQGGQHFKSETYFGGTEGWFRQREHDRRKREYAGRYSYNLLFFYPFNLDTIDQELEHIITRNDIKNP